MQSNKWVNAMVGLFVIFAVVGLFFLGFKASKLGVYSPGEVNTVTAKFGDVSGLGKQANVSLAGVQIGKVKSITLDSKGGDALVTMELTKQAEIPEDSSARILTTGLLGDKYIGIILGSSKKMIADGDKLKKTGGSVSIENMVQQFTGSGGAFYPNASYSLQANFNDITGITVGAPVKMSGVQIGQVKSITLDQKSFQAEVQLEIAKQYDQLPLDSSADILSSSLIGGKFIGISPGGETAFLKDGDQVMYTTSSVILEKLISQIVTSLAGKN